MELVLLPGMDGTGILFNPFIKFLDEHIRVTIIRYPPDKKLSYDELCAFVKERLPKNNEFILVAESFSSPIGFRLATENTPYLKTVIFVGSFLDPPYPILLTVVKRLPLSYLFRLQIPDFVVKHFLLGPNASDTLIELFKKSVSQVKSSVLADRLRMIADLKAGSVTLQIPCCYIQAKSDRLVSKRRLQLFEKLAPQIEVHQVEGPHLIMQVNPKGCIQIIQNELGLFN